MKQLGDQVWDAITNSAKTRFDYRAFCEVFADMGDDTVAENVLFLTIAGHAAGQSTEDIAAQINQHFLLIGMSLDEEYLTEFIEARRFDAVQEIIAAKIAMASFEMGWQPAAVLVQVRQVLTKTSHTDGV